MKKKALTLKTIEKVQEILGEPESERLNLPTLVPTLVLPGALVLPFSMLSVNATDPEERSLVDQALAQGRIIGILQPRELPSSGNPTQIQAKKGKSEKKAEDSLFFSVGGAARITSFTETDEGNYLIGLTGLCRFRVQTVHMTPQNFMLAEVDWTPFLADLHENEDQENVVDRDVLMNALNACCKSEGFMPDWTALSHATDEALISILAVALPLSVTEKQALLESGTLKERANLLIALLEMSIHRSENERQRH